MMNKLRGTRLSFQRAILHDTRVLLNECLPIRIRIQSVNAHAVRFNRPDEVFTEFPVRHEIQERLEFGLSDRHT